MARTNVKFADVALFWLALAITAKVGCNMVSARQKLDGELERKGNVLTLHTQVDPRCDRNWHPSCLILKSDV